MCCRVLLAAKVQDYGVWLCCMPLSPEPSESLHGSKRAGGVLPDHAFHTTDDSEGHDFSIEDRERCNIEEIKRERKGDQACRLVGMVFATLRNWLAPCPHPRNSITCTCRFILRHDEHTVT